ncbi:23S rRNA (guanosine(2251)-2'-O)-methyltransferase RlmB [Helicobacter cholecystus]|uniref:23S rRNA (guanosine(2251)-2'-O)-methyltransferase RlmB n=1 Tax=Helicobacter cholecystus TaxID=45498 RepID=UPI0027381E36|nr:23S rRNA (guanosine(2251)-2'-O)-methyltransferase RlmB [Helicobacter cholecystus]
MIVYGKQILFYVLQKCPDRLEEIYLAKEIDKKLFSSLYSSGVKILRIDTKKAQAMAHGGNHQGFLAKIKPIESVEKKEILSLKTLLVLCGISDVGNIGSIFRSAYALGVEGIIIGGTLSKNAIEGGIRASSGAMLCVPFYITSNLLELIHELKTKNKTCYGADMGGEEVLSIVPSDEWALFLGSEGEGLSGKIKQKMDKIISIKMKNEFNSLNVGVATGILVYRLKNG